MSNLVPDFISQSSKSRSSKEMLEWFRDRGREATTKGATHHRFSTHPSNRCWTLYEGWKERPYNDAGQIDEGEPRWQLSSSDQ
jgi:hypothetical protein